MQSVGFVKIKVTTRNIERQTLRENLRIEVSPDNLVDQMIEDERKWEAVEQFATELIKVKEETRRPRR